MDAAFLPVVLAHQGGWDEVLLVAGPLAVIAVLLWLANRRVHHELEQQASGREPDGE
jgi:hypothetical protein